MIGSTRLAWQALKSWGPFVVTVERTLGYIKETAESIVGVNKTGDRVKQAFKMMVPSITTHPHSQTATYL